MNIPNFLDTHMVDKEGKITEAWKGILMQLFTQMQTNLSDQTGVVIPQQPTTNITLLNDPKSTGSLMYDNTTHKLKVNLNGTFKEIVTL